MKRFGFALFFVIAVFGVAAEAQTGIFTYQGRLTDGMVAASGTYEMQFSLFDSLAGPTQIGSTITNSTVLVTNGVFTVDLDFSPATPFATGADRFLAIAVRKAADPPGFTLLTPRKQIMSAPYSIRSDSANTATTAGNVTGVVQIANGGTGSSTKNFVDLTTAQTVGGDKTFTGALAASNLSGTNTGNVTLAAVGSAPNANAATLTGQSLVLQPANGTNPGVLTAGTQTFGGDKTSNNNVTINGTLTATLGQSATSVFGTAPLAVNLGSPFALIPGLTQSITVPANSKVYISADGGVRTDGIASTSFSVVDVALVIDGALPADAGFRRVMAVNSTGATGVIQNWNLGTVVALTPGSHTIAVHAGGAGFGNATATVSGNNFSVIQGQLTVVIIKN
jgi:hypothetical protein